MGEDFLKKIITIINGKPNPLIKIKDLMIDNNKEDSVTRVMIEIAEILIKISVKTDKNHSITMIDMMKKEEKDTKEIMIIMITKDKTMIKEIRINLMKTEIMIKITIESMII